MRSRSLSKSEKGKDTEKKTKSREEKETLFKSFRDR